MTAYFDPKTDWATFAALGTGLSKDAGTLQSGDARDRGFRRPRAFDEARLKRYSLYPLDNRWCYYSSVTAALERTAPGAGIAACGRGKLPDRAALCGTSQRGQTRILYVRLARLSPASSQCGSDSASTAHISRRGHLRELKQSTMYEHLGEHDGTIANLSEGARQYLAALTSANPDEDEALSRSIWFHALAILYTPLYLSEHASAVRADWPRIPLPATLAALQHSAQLGTTAGQLLDMDSAALGVTTGKLRKELNFLGRVSGTAERIEPRHHCGLGPRPERKRHRDAGQGHRETTRVHCRRDRTPSPRAQRSWGSRRRT